MNIKIEIDGQKFEIETTLTNPDETDEYQEEWLCEVFDFTDGVKTVLCEDDLLESESIAACTGLSRIVSILNGDNIHCVACGKTIGLEGFCYECGLLARLED